jgi:hypothetical protein
VLGNSNLGQAIPVRITGERGERRGGTIQRLRKRSGVGRGESGERGVLGRGNIGPEEITSRGNQGREIGKNGRGREEDRGKPSMAAPMQAGHLDKIMHG